MLLYDKTNESVTPNAEFPIGGNKISIKTLDLNVSFNLLAKQLDEFAETYFGVIK